MQNEKVETSNSGYIETTEILEFWELKEMLDEDNIEHTLKPHMDEIFKKWKKIKGDEDVAIAKRREYSLKLLEKLIIPACVPKKWRTNAIDDMDNSGSFNYFAYLVTSIINYKYNEKQIDERNRNYTDVLTIDKIRLSLTKDIIDDVKTDIRDIITTEDWKDWVVDDIMWHIVQKVVVACGVPCFTTDDSISEETYDTIEKRVRKVVLEKILEPFGIKIYTTD